MNCLVLTRYSRLGASSRVRFYQYFPYLESHGLKVVTAPLLDDSYVERLYKDKPMDWMRIASDFFRRFFLGPRMQDFDLIWVESELFPWLPFLVDHYFFPRKIPYVLDLDDAVFHRYDLHQNMLVRRIFGHKIDRLMQDAALVTAGNEYLAERAHQSGAKWVEILPSVVDVSRYPDLSQNRCTPFTFGWIGSPVTEKYLHLISPALREACIETGARLLLVGARSFTIPGNPVEIRPWTEEMEAQYISEFDVGIMPLPDDPWAKGKCGYKLIQYMASRLPVVASPVGVNRQLVDHGENGFLASTNQEWVDSLTRLCRDTALRTRMGQASRQKVETQYSLQVTAPKVLSFLTSVMKGFQ